MQSAFMLYNRNYVDGLTIFSVSSIKYDCMLFC